MRPFSCKPRLGKLAWYLNNSLFSPGHYYWVYTLVNAFLVLVAKS